MGRRASPLAIPALRAAARRSALVRDRARAGPQHEPHRGHDQRGLGSARQGHADGQRVMHRGDRLQPQAEAQLTRNAPDAIELPLVIVTILINAHRTGYRRDLAGQFQRLLLQSG